MNICKRDGTNKLSQEIEKEIERENDHSTKYDND